MKNIQTILTGIAIILLFSFSQCKKNKNEEAQLPPETTTGAMTFGCKVNGQVFVPRDGRGRPGLFCQYVNLGTGPGGGWYLNIPAVDWMSSSPLVSVHIETDSLFVLDGVNYPFKNSKGSPLAFYQADDTYSALEIDNGYLRISKHDQINRILSGIFTFMGTTSSGKKVNVTEGRFDIRY